MDFENGASRKKNRGDYKTIQLRMPGIRQMFGIEIRISFLEIDRRNRCSPSIDTRNQRLFSQWIIEIPAAYARLLGVQSTTAFLRIMRSLERLSGSDQDCDQEMYIDLDDASVDSLTGKRSRHHVVGAEVKDCNSAKINAEEKWAKDKSIDADALYFLSKLFCRTLREDKR
ncbi:hypothetical protein WN51_09838 [Melipona quadrifasciata]|uniref:Uncharacterized protein n=1 Tax=Melipona quadrifasciata TaxID=166423 RepID=A0A0N0BII9_9HYME|nr:hypothetical protein WN51_09838 [Melipona quadrifasciata]